MPKGIAHLRKLDIIHPRRRGLTTLDKKALSSLLVPNHCVGNFHIKHLAWWDGEPVTGPTSKYSISPRWRQLCCLLLILSILKRCFTRITEREAKN
jgi:hypothetical protein